jgi:hypothetical protein
LDQKYLYAIAGPVRQITSSYLINPDGSLTSEGDRALGCIKNGAKATVIASNFDIPLETVKNLLGGLAPLTGCGGILNLAQIHTSDDLYNVLYNVRVQGRIKNQLYLLL